MIPTVLLTASVVYALIVAATLAWVHLLNRLDRLELLARHVIAADAESTPALPNLVMAPPRN